MDLKRLSGISEHKGALAWGMEQIPEGTNMTGRSANRNTMAISPAQLRLELDVASKTVDRLARTIQLVGDSGVTDPETSIELETHLGAAFAAAHRWLLETRLSATGTDVATTR